MLVSTLSSRLNRLVSTPLLRAGLTARYALAGKSAARDNPILDNLLFLPVAQKLISIETQEDATREARRRSSPRQEPTAFDRFVDKAWDCLVERGFANVANDTVVSVREETHDEYIRLRALESYLRPALVPNERWDDVVRWYLNRRFIRWARSEFLAARYGQELRDACSRCPELKVAQINERIKAKASVRDIFRHAGNASVGSDDIVLPSSRSLSKALNMGKWSRTKNVNAGWDRMKELAESLGGELFKIPRSDVYIPIIPPDTSVSTLSLEDLLELAGGHVYHSGPFNLLCDEGDIYEFWTKEYLAELSSYLLDRAEAFDGETLILDVGAGDGMLVYFLKGFVKREARRRLEGNIVPARNRGGTKGRIRRQSSLRLPKILATDDGSWKIKARSKVELINCKNAVAKYSKLDHENGNESHQLIVICSWMPMGEDWTKDMRAGGADEYILIGECDDGTCGDNWETWGNSEFFCDDELTHKGVKHMAPYVLDGFDRINLDNLSKLQYSRFDTLVSSNSKTVSFRRKTPDLS